MIKVQIRNFQSIEDAEVEIDGFTVITGPNNSGKSAVMRAIRGVFTNAPAGPLVRHGAKNLSVGILFPDGTDLLWEKGGKVNRYTLNGKELNSVGRGVPNEIAALGVAEIKAGSDRLWPQIAEQFTGSLFLVNRPGSVVAEALSDVDRVGTLTEALRLAESDRRSCSSELKVRRKDLQSHREQAAFYEGLDEVLATVTSLEDRRTELDKDETEVTTLGALSFQWDKASAEVRQYTGFDESVVPSVDSTDAAVVLRNDLSEAMSLHHRYSEAQGVAQATEGFDSVLSTLPAIKDQQDATAALREEWIALKKLSSRWGVLKTEADSYASEIPSLPTADKADKLRQAIEAVEQYKQDVTDAADQVAKLDIRFEEIENEVKEVQLEVDILLGSRGVCPTCNTVCVLQHAVGGEA